jgi:hypothetical protein
MNRQRLLMQELWRLHHGDRDRVISEYAAAESGGRVARRSNRMSLSAVDYAKRLFADGRRKGWLDNSANEGGSIDQKSTISRPNLGERAPPISMMGDREAWTQGWFRELGYSIRNRPNTSNKYQHGDTSGGRIVFDSYLWRKATSRHNLEISRSEWRFRQVLRQARFPKASTAAKSSKGNDSYGAKNNSSFIRADNALLEREAP